jgi:hypothetical protein
MLQVDPLILQFCLFRPSDLKRKEESSTEIDKMILFYYPQTHTLDTRVKNVGIGQTMEAFCGLFQQPNMPSYWIWKTRGAKSILLRAEGDYFFLMVYRLDLPLENKIWSSCYKD